MKILEDLYYGNIIPQEKTFIDDSRYGTLLNYVQRHENILLSEMTEQSGHGAQAKAVSSEIIQQLRIVLIRFS